MERINGFRRSLIGGSCAAISLSAVAQPHRTIRMVVPGPAGSAMDALARAISGPFGKLLGHAVVVDDLPGAGGTLATAQVARALPDGFTLEIISSNT